MFYAELTKRFWVRMNQVLAKSSGLENRGAGHRVRVRTVALPVEHGGWGLTLEPVALGLLDEIRVSTNDYTPPIGGSENHRALYQALRELEADLLEHIHLEDSLLFPRALGTRRHGRV